MFLGGYDLSSLGWTVFQSLFICVLPSLSKLPIGIFEILTMAIAAEVTRYVLRPQLTIYIELMPQNRSADGGENFEIQPSNKTACVHCNLYDVCGVCSLSVVTAC